MIRDDDVLLAVASEDTVVVDCGDGYDADAADADDDDDDDDEFSLG